MDNLRKTDLDTRSRYRTDRFIKDGEDWYFSTREGTIEGPFELKQAAEARLEIYKKIMASGLINADSTLAIQALE